jgi:hypothetical protein
LYLSILISSIPFLSVTRSFRSLFFQSESDDKLTSLPSMLRAIAVAEQSRLNRLSEQIQQQTALLQQVWSFHRVLVYVLIEGFISLCLDSFSCKRLWTLPIPLQSRLAQPTLVFFIVSLDQFFRVVEYFGVGQLRAWLPPAATSSWRTLRRITKSVCTCALCRCWV